MPRFMRQTACAFLVIVLGAAALIGYGFAAWSFSDTYAAASTEISVTVADVSYVGSWEPVTDLPTYVVVDEGIQSDTFASLQGLTFYRTGDDNVPISDNTVTITFRCSDEITKKAEVEKLIFGFKGTISGGLANYFQPNANSEYFRPLAGAPENEGYLDLKQYVALQGGTASMEVAPDKEERAEGDDNYTVTFTVTTGLFNSLFCYKDGMRPDSQEKLNALRNDIATGSTVVTLYLWQGSPTPASEG